MKIHKYSYKYIYNKINELILKFKKFGKGENKFWMLNYGKITKIVEGIQSLLLKCYDIYIYVYIKIKVI